MTLATAVSLWMGSASAMTSSLGKCTSIEGRCSYLSSLLNSFHLNLTLPHFIPRFHHLACELPSVLVSPASDLTSTVKMFIVPGLMFLITTLVVAQMEPLACSTSTNDCTMTFSVSKPAQTGPTTTLYDSIMTSSLNIINCRYCAVTNVENNAPDVVSSSHRYFSTLLT